MGVRRRRAGAWDERVASKKPWEMSLKRRGVRSGTIQGRMVGLSVCGARAGRLWGACARERLCVDVSG